MFTSGTSGKPKGVQITHRNLMSHMAAMATHDWRPADTVIQQSSISFDMVLIEIWVPLCIGACIVPGEARAQKDAPLMVQQVSSAGISIACLTPAELHMWMESGLTRTCCPKLRAIYTGGEALTHTLLNRVQQEFPGIRVVHMYGPTEATMHGLELIIDGPVPQDRPISVGRPLPNTHIYILDPQMQPVPIRVPGEITIAGPRVARGYLNRLELTSAAFVPSLTPHQPGCQRMYRTGDLGAWNADGTVQIIGRIDRQVSLSSALNVLFCDERAAALSPDVACSVMRPTLAISHLQAQQVSSARRSIPD